MTKHAQINIGWSLPSPTYALYKISLFRITWNYKNLIHIFSILLFSKNWKYQSKQPEVSSLRYAAIGHIFAVKCLKLQALHDICTRKKLQNQIV